MHPCCQVLVIWCDFQILYIYLLIMLQKCWLFTFTCLRGRLMLLYCREAKAYFFTWRNFIQSKRCVYLLPDNVDWLHLLVRLMLLYAVRLWGNFSWVFSLASYFYLKTFHMVKKTMIFKYHVNSTSLRAERGGFKCVSFIIALCMAGQRRYSSIPYVYGCKIWITQAWQGSSSAVVKESKQGFVIDLIYIYMYFFLKENHTIKRNSGPQAPRQNTKWSCNIGM